MRKLVILSLVSVVLLAAASDAFAQRRGGGGRGGARGGYYGGRGYYGRGYYGGAYYGGLGWYGGYYPYYGYGYSPGYYGSSPYYYTAPSTSVPYYTDSATQAAPVAQAGATTTSQSFYLDPNASTVNVMVPNADAQVWFDGAPTQQRGMERTYHTPALQQAGTYTIKARWMENGNPVDRERTVRVQPGRPARVDFRAPLENSEGLRTPRNTPPKD
jgi:uncharacterized protein (TIGR03000 family)